MIFHNPAAGDRDFYAASGTYVEGDHVDRWGCVWSNIQHGSEAIATGHPVPTPDEIDEQIRTSVAALGSPEGGLPIEIIEAIFVSLAKYRGYFRAA